MSDQPSTPTVETDEDPMGAARVVGNGAPADHDGRDHNGRDHNGTDSDGTGNGPTALPLNRRPAPDLVLQPTGAARLLTRLRPPRTPDPFAERIRPLPDPKARPPAVDDTQAELPPQPISIDHLSGPVRQRVLEALAARSRALAMVSVTRSVLGAAVAFVLGEVLSVGTAWYCLHKVSPTVLTDPVRQVLPILVLAGLIPIVVAVIVYAVCRLVHHRAIRNNKRLAGPLVGLAAVAVLAGAMAGILRPWSFPAAAARPATLSTVEFALSTNGYRALTFGVVPKAQFSSQTAIYIEAPTGEWLVAPVHEPLPVLFTLALRHARMVPAPDVAQVMAGPQLAALSQRSDLLWGLLGLSVLLAAVLTVAQLWRWRVPPAARVPERSLRALVTSLQTSGTLPAGWGLGEPALGRRRAVHASFG